VQAALAYLQRAVVNGAKNQRRAAAVRTSYTNTWRAQPAAVGPEVQAVVGAEHAEILDALATLPMRQRRVLVLRYFLDQSEAQTAVALSISKGSVKQYEQRAGRGGTSDQSTVMIFEDGEYGHLADALKAAMVHSVETSRPDFGETQAALVRLHRRMAGTGVRSTASRLSRAGSGGPGAAMGPGGGSRSGSGDRGCRVVLVMVRVGRLGHGAPAPGSVSSSVSGTSASPQTSISGDPVPAVLRGTWSGLPRVVGGVKVTEQLVLSASTGPDGAPRIAGHRWDSAEAAKLVREHGGSDARLLADTDPERFDVLNLLVATDGAVQRFGHDVRRLRPNIVLSGVPADHEPELPGQAVAIGDALIGVHSVRQRCIVTTIDPGTREQDLDVLRRIRDFFGGELALNCWVVRPGLVRIGDPARIVPIEASPPHIGGWIV
jgi:uncharacterized protein